MRALWHVLVGPPVRARDVSREQIAPVEGLSALSLDALTSVAYGPDVVVARVPAPVHVHGRAAPLRTAVTRSRAQAKASRGGYQPGGCARP